jgi:hypothetical protein
MNVRLDELCVAFTTLLVFHFELRYVNPDLVIFS